MKRLLLWSVLLLLFLGLAAVLLDIPVIVEGYLRHESFFQGKPTTYWKTKLGSHDKSLANPDRDFQLALKEFKRGGSKAVPVLLESLKDPPPLVRERAVKVLGELGADAAEAVPDLIEKLGDTNDRVRLQAEEALKQVVREADKTGSKEIRTVLTQALRHRDNLVRVPVAELLFKMEGVATPYAPVVIEALKDDRDDVRERAAITLGRMGPRAVKAVPALVQALSDRQEKVRGWVIWALGEIGSGAKAAEPALQQAAQDPKKEIREAATAALKKIEVAHRRATSEKTDKP